MNVRIPRFAPARAGLLGIAGVAVLAAACETSLPTSAEVNRMDVAAAETQASRFHMIDGANMKYTVDGKPVSVQEARALTAGRIAQIEVRRTAEGGTVNIITGATGGSLRLPLSPEHMAPTPGDSSKVRIFTQLHSDGTGPVAMHAPERFEGLTVIDGRIVAQGELRSINPSRIEKVEVIKGAAAAQLFPAEPRAAQGVIRITTKPAAQ